MENKLKHYIIVLLNQYMTMQDKNTCLSKFYCDDDIMEIGIDEAGRGPLFGRVYTAAVILPKDNDDFDHSLMKDSKKFTSSKKIQQARKYIMEHAVAWSITWSEHTEIDKINIRQATLASMHHSITKLINKDKLKGNTFNNFRLLVDGNDFKPFVKFDSDTNKYNEIPNVCIKQGDNSYSSIAAASILAKTERDEYISNLCEKFPLLETLYGIASNKGYGTKKHMSAIRDHGVTPWHRRSYGICKTIHSNNQFETDKF